MLSTTLSTRRTARSAALIALCLALLARAADADVIHYKDGRTLEGKVLSRTATEVTVQTSFGTIKVPASKIARIEERSTPAEELATRRGALAAGDVAGRFELALWAAEAGLESERRALLLEVVELDPGHALANELLGRIQVDGRWLDPEAVDAYVASREEEQRARGLLWDGGRWQPEAEVMERRGFVRVHDAWVARRAGEATLLLEALAAQELVLEATEGRYVTLFSDLPPDSAEALVLALDDVVRDFVLRLQPDEQELQWLQKYDIPVIALPDIEAVSRCMDSDALDRYGASADFKERFRTSRGFSAYWPRPLIGLVAHGEHLQATGDEDLARIGIAVHQLAHVLIQRFKGTGTVSVPGWMEAGLAAFYEGLTTQYSTITITSFNRNERNEAQDPFVPHWEDFNRWHENLRQAEKRQTAGSWKVLMGQRVEELDSREIGLSWSVLRYLFEKHPNEVRAYLRAWSRGPESEGRQPPLLHEHAWQAAFGEELDAVESRWQAWAENQPVVLIPERLLGRDS